LAALLRGFGVTPGTVQLDDKITAKGYKRNDLEDSFSRYLHSSPDPNRQNVKPSGAVGESGDFQNVNGNRFDGLKKDSSWRQPRPVPAQTHGRLGVEAPGYPAAGSWRRLEIEEAELISGATVKFNLDGAARAVRRGRDRLRHHFTESSTRVVRSCRPVTVACASVGFLA
jgi:hypothetical protein